VSIPRGLGPEPKTSGTLIAYSTQPDTVADDGTDRNSPFVKALLDHIAEPGLDIRLLFAGVRSDVLNRTGGAQTPETSDSLNGRFMFRKAEPVVVNAGPPASPVAGVPPQAKPVAPGAVTEPPYAKRVHTITVRMSPAQVAALTPTPATDDNLTNGGTSQNTPGTIQPSVVHAGLTIQVGAFDVEQEARDRISAVQAKVGQVLKHARPHTEAVTAGEKTLYRARFTGIEKDQAEAICRVLKRNEIACMTIN
jgi:hypothetical protein